MTNNRLALMVIAWNNADDVAECIDSLAKQTVEATLLVVDNDSRPEQSDRLAKIARRYDAVYTTTGHNGGTAGGFNYGITWAIDHGYEFVGTLNADAVADAHWVESMLAALESNGKNGIAAGILARRDGKTIDTTGDFYTTWGIPGPRLRDAQIDNAPKKPQQIFGSTGGAFLARTSLFADIGLFDEAYFMYFEDVDISFRAQLRGWKVQYTPDAIAYHKLGASSNTVPGLAVYNTFKNLPLLFIKNVPGKLWWTYAPRFKLAYILILANAIKNGRGKYALKGHLKSIRLIPHAFRERRTIQKQRTVSAEYIDSIILHDIPPEQTGLRKFRKIFTGK